MHLCVYKVVLTLVILLAPTTMTAWVLSGVEAWATAAAFSHRRHGTQTRNLLCRKISMPVLVSQFSQARSTSYQVQKPIMNLLWGTSPEYAAANTPYHPQWLSRSAFIKDRRITKSTARLMSSIDNENGESRGGQKDRKRTKALSSDELELETELVEGETRAWVNRVVIGMNLCPFAAKPVIDKQLYVSVIWGDDLEEILKEILAQSLVFLEDNVPGTALLVCPDLVPNDFNEYLNVLTMVVDGLLEDHELTGRVQVVPFHPEFIFAGDNDDDDNNNNNKMEYWTNRSPYPMFHILKEDDVSHAIDLVKGNTDKVWQRNVHLLQRIEALAKEDFVDNEGCNISSKANKIDVLQAYLRTGEECKRGTAMSIINQALEETSIEFPLIQKLLSTSGGQNEVEDTKR